MRILQASLFSLVCVSAQAQPSASRFEVVSVKPPPAVGQSFARLGCVGNRFVFSGIPLTRLLQWAYDLPSTRIVGLPIWIVDWVNKTDSMYEIDARATSVPSDSVCKAMVQSVLTDRFKMVARLESRELRAYALTVAKKGSKMHKIGAGETGRGVTVNGIPVRSVAVLGDTPGGISMKQFARRLSGVPILGAPVIDRTGLSGIYSFDLNFSVAESDERPAIWTAVEEQLGLKLEPVKAPIEVLVVDHIERPTPN